MSTKPGVPRPSLRKAPVSEPASAPPAIRDRLPTLELEDDDLVVDAEPVVARRARSSPPPPPPARSAVVPKLEGAPAPMPTIAPLRAPNIDLTMPSSMASRKPVPHMLKLITPTVSIVPEPPRVASSPPLVEVAPRSRVEARRSRPESLLDPTEVLFEVMYALEHVESSWQAASVCAEALARALGARSVVVHAHDLVGRELRAIGAHGDHAVEILGTSGSSDDDLVAAAVICNEKAVTMRFDGELPRLAPRRLELIGAPRTLVAVPAMAWGRCVAMIEVIDADDRYAARVSDAAGYVAERLAAYLSGRRAA